MPYKRKKQVKPRGFRRIIGKPVGWPSLTGYKAPPRDAETMKEAGRAVLANLERASEEQAHEQAVRYTPRLRKPEEQIYHSVTSRMRPIRPKGRTQKR